MSHIGNIVSIDKAWRLLSETIQNTNINFTHSDDRGTWTKSQKNAVCFPRENLMKIKWSKSKASLTLNHSVLLVTRQIVFLVCFYLRHVDGDFKSIHFSSFFFLWDSRLSASVTHRTTLYQSLIPGSSLNMTK